ncbi:anti-sigma regulatory factor [Fibrisoma montanum]|uniref:Anti-sigma regulatory factor n=1 Tax=Fibrisoma montanum TaxID=2305895 RepID=A0A418MFE8_9BACT|nr:anti-sigma regulatory factor [Fibrisoma montanum]RIV25511.1 anti-sigma regulatory factor [Fibrisoma montanum]
MIIISSSETASIRTEQDVARLLHRIKAVAADTGLGTVSQTKLMTAASELARNMLFYANEGVSYLEQISQGTKVGIRLTFIDHGPGIPDVDLAMQDGYTTNPQSLGLGLPGARRLVNEFAIISTVGKGTTVTVITWKL